VTASLLSRSSSSTDFFHGALLDDVVDDVVDTAGMLIGVGGVLPDGVFGKRRRVERNVHRCLLVLGLFVDKKSKKIESKNKNTGVFLMESPTFRLELSSIRNQWVHLLPSLPYEDVLGVSPDQPLSSSVIDCMRRVVQHRYRLRVVPEGGRHSIRLTERQERVLRCVVRSAVEVYVVVGKHLHLVLNKAEIEADTSAIALRVQRSLAKYARTIDADALALDTLKNAVDYFVEGKSSEGVPLAETMALLLQARARLFSTETAAVGDVDSSIDESLLSSGMIKLWEL
jgi:hypothetical protein